MNPELVFHQQAWKLICAYRRREVLAFHAANGEKRSAVTGARLKSMGVVPGVPDLILVVRGHVHFIELKVAKGRLSEDQRAFLAQAESAGATTHVARSMDAVIAILNSIGALRVRLTQPVHGDPGAQPDTEGAEALG